MVVSKPNQCKQWLSAATEWWCNTNFHTGLKCTPFKALYGYTPPQLCIGPLLENVVQVAEDVIIQWQQFLQLLKDNLHATQARMLFFADNRKTDREVAVGDLVYLKLQPYKQTSLVLRRNLKLNSKYYGPYLVIARIGNVAYKLVLLPESKVHPIFHVPLLKKKVGNRVVVKSSLPNSEADGQFIMQPVAILQRQMVKQNNVVIVKMLVQ
ncbi:uncharacterized protein [Solanum tuberosum]|uniref:uncharacterized protein n=1 Tax=Solanum tuberosum TaxID=4113 RepID=UPI000739FFAC|nr:PREDICTED: uncharacterized protein LOC107058075 [Solanum tuberosum]